MKSVDYKVPLLHYFDVCTRIEICYSSSPYSLHRENHIFTHRNLLLQFSVHKRSIIALGDITEVIPDEEADVAVLEEPEHLTWYHHGKRWKLKFKLVVGVVHTNYLEYVKREKNGQFQAFLLKYMNSWVVNIYCHRVSLTRIAFLQLCILRKWPFIISSFYY